MKKNIILTGIASMLMLNASAQLYSSGNNVIAGNSVGIGIAAPLAKLHVYQNSNSVVEHVRMQNASSTGAGKFMIYNDNPSNYFTFTKYGSAYAGGYTGISGLFPYANLLAFGNNGGGILLSNAGNIGLNTVTGGVSTLKFFVDYATGKIGIGGNATPRAQVHINTSSTNDTLRITNATTGHTATDGIIIANTGTAASIINMENSNMTLGTNNTVRMTLFNNGTILMGNTATPAGYRLYVETGILTEKIKVALKTSGNWADYVFADDYKLQPLHEVEQYIHTHKHLPGIPSADEVVAEGLDLASMDAKLLEKIEELTLHMIQLEKEVNTLKQKNEVLTEQLNNK
ncbi:MAG: hypothetical protein IPN14_12200 [Bacteroidetes bacterium]|jgi:hypothetical protein|nr:hypothetical protein [Bacteroidota bacterium]MBK9301337.1 hypothetical protein [Bacteroidota bacterium]MBK9482994.1 hypothetical protein [Bacteroidota bacterium]